MDDDLNFECSDCRTMFVFTIGEQRFFADRELSQPKRCPNCRRVKRERQPEGARSLDWRRAELR